LLTQVAQIRRIFTRSNRHYSSNKPVMLVAAR
jgi:hypothetical protein